MKERIYSQVALIWMVVCFSPSARSQSLIRTILGASNDGVPAVVATLNTPSAVASDPTGNVYVALKGSHQIIRIGKDVLVRLIAGNGSQGSAGDGGPALRASFNNIAAMTLDISGNLYIADSAANRIRRIGTDGVVSTFAGNGKSGYTGDGGPATDAALKTPSALAFDINGNLIISDTGNHAIRMVTADGVITTIVGNGSKGSDGDDGPAQQATLNSPSGLAADNAGNVYIADTGNNWIRVITPDGVIARFAGRDSSAGPGGPFGGGGDSTVALNASLSSPTNLAVDQAGSVYLMESGGARVRRITSDGKIASYAGTGTAGASGDGGLARSANINVQGIAIGSKNDLIIADGTNNRVRIVTAKDGIIDTLAGNGLASYNPRGLAVQGSLLYFSDGNSNRIRTYNLASGELGLFAGDGGANFAGDGGYAVSASLNAPRGMAFDKSGNLFIADSANHRIREVTTHGKIKTIAGTGTASTTGNDGAATSATLNEPVAVAVDNAGNLFIAERSGHVVRKVATDGTISTVAGTGKLGPPDGESGVAIEQKLSSPQGLALEPSGSLLIADTGNNRIRRLSADGTIMTVAGSDAGFSGDGGPAASALLRGPVAVYVDATGIIYIADTNNQAIRRIGPDGTISTVAGNGSAGYNGDGSPATDYSLNIPSAITSVADGSLIVADTQNQRLRQLLPATENTVSSHSQRSLQ